GFWELMEAMILPKLATVLAEAAPEISLTTLRVKRREIEMELASGSLDMALDVPINTSESIRHKPLFSDRVVVVARAGHPAIDSELDLDTYLSQNHVLVSSRRFGPSLVDTELNRKGKKRQIDLRCQNYFAACRVVSETDMLLTMPEHYAEMLNSRFGNRQYPFPLKSLQTLDIHMYWHESADNDPANRWLREQITKGVEEAIQSVAAPPSAAQKRRSARGTR